MKKEMKTVQLKTVTKSNKKTKNPNSLAGFNSSVEMIGESRDLKTEQQK